MKLWVFFYKNAVRHISFLYIPFEGLPVYPDDVYASICLHVEWILQQAAEKKAKYFQIQSNICGKERNIFYEKKLNVLSNSTMRKQR